MIQYILRPAQKKDLSDLLNLSRSFPLYNLPNHKELLKEKLELSEESFQKKKPPFERNYVFALEDLKLKKVIGSSQILSFSRKNQTACYFLEKERGDDYLRLVSIKKQRQQLGGLVLSKKYRGLKEQLGLQLGLSRFLYMKNKAEDFSKTLEVSLTGPFQTKDNPFWRETGAQYLKQNYLQALKLYRNSPADFLKKLPKEFKIHLKSLSAKARLCLETVHPKTLPAYKGLLKRGFKPSRRHHILDGGLYLESGQPSLLKKIQSLELRFEKPKSGAFFLISQAGSKNFLAARVKGERKGNLLMIEKTSLFKEGAKALSLPLT